MIAGILQARMGSTRFPSKVLKEIKGKSLLELYVNRVSPSRKIQKIIIATTDKPADEQIEKLAAKIGVECFRGSENDLLDRYYQCAKKFEVDVIVRLTPDDPFVDHEVIDRAIEIFIKDNVDFVTNHFDPTYPEGLDIEVYSFAAMERSWKEAKLLSEREHVFPYIQNNPDKFKIVNFKQEKDYSHFRWTIDHACDFEMTKKIYEFLYNKKQVFLQDDILNLLKEHPEIAEMNSHIKRKEGVNKTKANDKIVKHG
jgi:spore coat polysaccharide biosynthesis protein SpsF (cytidylyltransferase family)